MANDLDNAKASLLYIQSGIIDPSVVGLDSESGTLYLQLENGFRLFQKQDDVPSTSWRKIAFLDEVVGSGGLTEAHGSFAAPIVINPLIGIVPTAAPDQTWWLTSGGGSQDITAIPAIANGSTIGQRLTLKGVSFPNHINIDLGFGVDLNGRLLLDDNQACQLQWDGTQWSENFRRK